MSVQGQPQGQPQYTTEHQYQPQGGQEHRPVFGGGGGPVRRGGRKPFFLTSEFLVLVATILAVVIATAAADSFDAKRCWTLVTVLAAAYIISRGLSKIGRGDGNVEDSPLSGR